MSVTLTSIAASRFNEAAGFTQRKPVKPLAWNWSKCGCFNEAAGFTQRKQAAKASHARCHAASMRPPVLPSGNGNSIADSVHAELELQ